MQNMTWPMYCQHSLSIMVPVILYGQSLNRVRLNYCNTISTETANMYSEKQEIGNSGGASWPPPLPGLTVWSGFQSFSVVMITMIIRICTRQAARPSGCNLCRTAECPLSESEKESVNMTTDANGFGAHATAARLIMFVSGVCRDG